MASTSLDSDSNQSPIKRRKIDVDIAHENRLNNSIDQTRWKNATEQQIYTSNLVKALRKNRVRGGNVVRETADRVLAITAKGKTRWSRSILTSRLSLRICKINRIHKIAKVRKMKSQKMLKYGKDKGLKNKVELLGSLIPGCNKVSFPALLEETSDYIAALEMQVRAMTVLTELLAGGPTSVASQSS